ncbi:DUF3800 domain-containing protein [Zhongshania sp.]|uniref:DUF3800 domain-containing protein n=1 Tax=Zhongshania sp. TaxID=1971902 RepID=UPI0035664139
MYEKEQKYRKKAAAREDHQLPLFEFDAKIKALAYAPTTDEISRTEGSPFSRHIVYVDESGDHNLQAIDKSYPIFVLAFCSGQQNRTH